MTRVAIADLGTNTTRLMVADVSDGTLRELRRELEITRLGEGVDLRRALATGAMERTVAALRRFAAAAAEDRAERSEAIATSAVRDAANRGALLERVAALGFAPRLLSGEAEAALALRGALHGLSGPAAGTLVVDVGGGSTELALADAAGAPAWRRSLDLGGVRLTERLLGEEAVEPAAERRCADLVAGELAAAVPPAVVSATRRLLAVAGTPTTLACLERGLTRYQPDLVHGYELPRERLAAWQERLCRMTLAERRALPAMEAGRAPVICAGTLILRAVVERLDLAALVVSDRDTLHGAALELAERDGAPPAG